MDSLPLAVALAISVACWMAPVCAEEGYVEHRLHADVSGLGRQTNLLLLHAWGVALGSATPWLVDAIGDSLRFCGVTGGQISGASLAVYSAKRDAGKHDAGRAGRTILGQERTVGIRPGPPPDPWERG